MSSPLNFTLTLMSDLLRNEYKVKVANSGRQALNILQGDTPPDMDGDEVLRRLKAPPVPNIFP